MLPVQLIEPPSDNSSPCDRRSFWKMKEAISVPSAPPRAHQKNLHCKADIRNALLATPAASALVLPMGSGLRSYLAGSLIYLDHPFLWQLLIIKMR
jgi:hypothetical protein